MDISVSHFPIRLDGNRRADDGMFTLTVTVINQKTYFEPVVAK